MVVTKRRNIATQKKKRRNIAPKRLTHESLTLSMMMMKTMYLDQILQVKITNKTNMISLLL